MADQRTEPQAGLCASCRYAEIIQNDRGSKFVICLRSKLDPAFRKYPPLPVIACRGYEKEEGRDGKSRPA